MVTSAGEHVMDVCIVGCGQIARKRVRDIVAQTGLRVAAVVDSNAHRAELLAEKSGGRHKPMILTEIDDPASYGLAVIQTPNGLHRKCAEPFVEAGVPVVVEKPLTLTWQDMAWFAERELAGSWICGAYNSRFSPGVVEAYQSSRYEKIVTISSSKIRKREAEYYNDGWHGTWAQDGGVLAQQAIHCLDLVCWAAGDRAPLRVAALGFNRRHAIECEDTGTILIDFGDFAATVTGTTAAGRNGAATFEIVTTEGIWGTEDWGWDDGASPLWHAISEALRNDGPPPVSVASVLPALRTLHAAYQSIDERGAWVEIGQCHPRLGIG